MAIKLSVEEGEKHWESGCYVDLNTMVRYPVKTGISWTVRATATGFFGFGHGKVDGKAYVRLRELSVDSRLLVTSDSLFSLDVDGQLVGLTKSQDSEVSITKEENKFTLCFDPRAVRDCKEPQNSVDTKYIISLTIDILDEKSKCVATEIIDYALTFAPIRPDVTLQLSLDRTEVEYNEADTVKIGYLTLENRSMLQHCPEVNYRVRLYAGDDAVCEGAVNCADKETGSFHKEEKLPVYLDFSKIKNPGLSAGCEYELTIKGQVSYGVAGNENIGMKVSPKAKLLVKGDPEKPSLLVTIKDPVTGNTKNITQPEPVRLERIAFLPGERLVTNIPITLINTATKSQHSGVGVMVRNISYKLQLPKMAEIVYSKPQDDLHSLVRFDAPESVMLANKPNSQERLEIELHWDAVRDLYVKKKVRDYNVEIKAKVEFDYCLDPNGRCDIMPSYFDEHKEHYEVIVTIPVYQRPNPQWLAIDFGTSAIVARFGEESIDLRKYKTKLFGAGQEDTYEEGTPFLSSNLLLRNVKNANDTHLLRDMDPDERANAEFGKLAVCLSPTSSFERANVNTMLPCLKLLVGYERVPNLENYSAYNYNHYESDADGKDKLVKAVKLTYTIQNAYGEDVELYSPLAYVDTVFEEVYDEFFKFYLTDAIRVNLSQINQIVLTVPNSYSPMHIHRIREIVRKSLANTNIRNLCFVSESDAVASYYHKNWGLINNCCAPLKNRDHERLQRKETVLVYDMGAGTLDLTLFERSIDSDGNATLTILGKTGIAKAGNYLDTLLANLVAAKIPALKKFADPAQITDADRLRSALQLKSVVRNSLKPALSRPGETSFKFAQNSNLGVRSDTEIDIADDITSSAEFGDYIRSVTTDIIGNFLSSYGKVKLDTVLLSGRSAKLKPLRDQLKKVLKEFGNSEMQIIDIGAIRPNNKFDLSKTVVVEGAVDFAKSMVNEDSTVKIISPNITASYGIIFTNAQGMVSYQELLNPRKDKPTATVQNEGMLINTYETEQVQVDLSGSETVKLVQTYSPSPSATLRDWTSDNREYITEVSEINVAAITQPSKARVQLRVDENNSMSLEINGMEREDIIPVKIDINSKSNRYSLWPIVAPSNTN